MGLLQKIARRVMARAAKYAGIPLRDPALVAMLGAVPTSSGVDVDEHSALNASAVWQAVTLLSSSVASLPIEVYTYEAGDNDEDKRIAYDHPVWELLNVQPNRDYTPYTFHETLQAHALMWGNGFAHIERERGIPIALTPMMPNQVYPDRDGDGNIIYRFRAIYRGERDAIYYPAEVLHIAGLGFDGLKGYPVIQVARESIGLNLAAEKFGGAFFGRGSVPGGVIKHPDRLNDKAKINLRESWEIMHRGPDNAHRIAVLDEGMEWQQIGTPLEDAEFLKTRTFQVMEIARWFNIPPHMLRDLSQATFSNIEHQGLDFLIYSLSPWLIRWQQEYRRKLFADGERRRYYLDHVTFNLTKTDTLTRFISYRTARETGFYTLNDIMKRENMPALAPEIGDVRLQPLNMEVAGVGNPIDPNRIVATLDVIRQLRPVDRVLAKAILESSLSRPRDELVEGLLNKLESEGIYAGNS